MNELKQMLDELAKRIKDTVIDLMSSDIGVNQKVGRNTLIGSDLMNSLKTTTGEDYIVFQIADYYENVVKGRPKGLMINSEMEQSLLEWIRKKNIRFDGCDETTTLYLVEKSIVEKGIAARPFIGVGDDPSVVLPFLDNYFDKWADEVFEMIIKKIDQLFK